MNLRILLLCLCCAVWTACSSQNARPSMAPDTVVLGAIDQPRSGAEFRQPFAILGWAWAADGVQWVGIYSDGEFLGYAKVGLSRPDVQKVYPDKRGTETSGWQFDADPGLFIHGGHKITVDVCSKTGTVHSLGTIEVNTLH
jgi:hypothetical protein